MDTFTQPKITGYRQLGQRETDLMNAVKLLDSAMEQVVKEIKEYHKEVTDKAARMPTAEDCARELARFNNAEPERWLAMGRTDIQQGVMKLVRSIAQPATPTGE